MTVLEIPDIAPMLIRCMEHKGEKYTLEYDIHMWVSSSIFYCVGSATALCMHSGPSRMDTVLEELEKLKNSKSPSQI